MSRDFPFKNKFGKLLKMHKSIQLIEKEEIDEQLPEDNIYVMLFIGKISILCVHYHICQRWKLS